jgi:hypothetical protein
MDCFVHWTLTYILLGCQLKGKKNPQTRPWQASASCIACPGRPVPYLSLTSLAFLREKSLGMPVPCLPVHSTSLPKKKSPRYELSPCTDAFLPTGGQSPSPGSSTNKMSQFSALHSRGLAVQCPLAPWEAALMSTCQKRQTLIQKAGLLRIVVTVITYRTKISGSA